MLSLALPAVASAAPERLLTIEIAGGGIGEVECREGSGPVEACEAEYPDGTELTLAPVAEEGSSFAGFSAGTGSAAGCTGTGACTFTITADSGITATFEAVAEYSFEVNLAGEGEGEVECTVASEPEQFCDGEYPAGTRLKLEPVAEEGSEFAGFSAGTGSATGCTGKTSATCPSFRIEADSSIVATFEYKEYALTVIKQGGGSGTVECEAEEGPEVCKNKYIWGMEVVLRAKPAPGSEFTGWTGLSGCERVFGPGGTECEVEMIKAHTVRANFALAAGGGEEGGEEPPPEEGGEEPPPEEGGEEEAGEEEPPPGGGGGGNEETPGGGSGGGTGGGGSSSGGGSQSSGGGGVSGGGSTPSTAPPPRGVAAVARLASVRGSMAALRLRCAGAGACAGTLELKAKLPARASSAGRRRRAASFVRIGGAHFSLSAGGSATVRLRVRRAAAGYLAHRGRLAATVAGTGVTASAIVLKAAKKPVKHR